MANSRELTDQYLSYMRYREMHFQTEYIFTTCKEIKKNRQKRKKRNYIFGSDSNDT